MMNATHHLQQPSCDHDPRANDVKWLLLSFSFRCVTLLLDMTIAITYEKCHHKCQLVRYQMLDCCTNKQEVLHVKLSIFSLELHHKKVILFWSPFVWSENSLISKLWDTCSTLYFVCLIAQFVKMFEKPLFYTFCWLFKV